MRVTAGLVPFVLLLLAAGCRDGTGPAIPEGSELRLEQSVTLVGTAESAMEGAVRVRVADPRGRGVLGVTVRIESLPDEGSEALLLTRSAGLSGSYQQVTMGFTDAAGEVAFHVLFGEQAGTGSLLISAPILQQSIILPFEVREFVPSAASPGPSPRLALGW